MRNVLRTLLAVMVATGGLLAAGPRPALAGGPNGVVGDGTPASCTYAELNFEMGEPGTITFACGPAPHTIILEADGGMQPLAGQATTLDGGGLITLSAANVAGRRLFAVPATASLTLTHLTLANAVADSFAGGALSNQGYLELDDVEIHHAGTQNGQAAGGIYNNASLVVRNSRLHDNYASGGAALVNQFGADATIENTIFRDNIATDGAWGGAISNSGEMTITASSFSGNKLNRAAACGLIQNYVCGGGAIANLGAVLGIRDSSFSGNTTNQDGGAILNRGLGQLRLESTQLTGNTAGLGGGAIANALTATVALTGGVMAGNQASEGGGFSNKSHGMASLTQVTIEGNRATTGNGGGLLNNTGTALLTHLTVSGNTASDYGGGIANQAGVLTATHVTLGGNQGQLRGGGFWNAESSSATLTFVTLSGNFANISGGGADGGSVTTLKSVLLADNRPDNCGEFFVGSGTFSLSTDASCLLAGSGNQLSTPLLLGPLANNGGPTLTQLPAPDSAAIDSGQCVGGLDVDQRGLPRLVGASCDVGAAERQADDFGWYLFLPAARR